MDSEGKDSCRGDGGGNRVLQLVGGNSYRGGEVGSCDGDESGEVGSDVLQMGIE